MLSVGNTVKGKIVMFVENELVVIRTAGGVTKMTWPEIASIVAVRE